MDLIPTPRSRSFVSEIVEQTCLTVNAPPCYLEKERNRKETAFAVSFVDGGSLLSQNDTVVP